MATHPERNLLPSAIPFPKRKGYSRGSQGTTVKNWGSQSQTSPQNWCRWPHNGHSQYCGTGLRRGFISRSTNREKKKSLGQICPRSWGELLSFPSFLMGPGSKSNMGKAWLVYSWWVFECQLNSVSTRFIGSRPTPEQTQMFRNLVLVPKTGEF